MNRAFLRSTCFSFAVIIALTTLCYFFLDRSLAFWVQKQGLPHFFMFKWMTYIAPLIGTLCFFCILFLAIVSLTRKLKKTEKVFLFASLSVAIATYLKECFKIIFGRYWISTWIHGNPSLLENNAYGFNFLKSDASFQSFPSGHTVVTCSALTFFWIYFPKYRIGIALLALLQMMGQIGMNYHYLSDVLVGAFLGISTSLFFIKLNKTIYVD